MTDNCSLHDLIRMIGSDDPNAFTILYMKMSEPLYKHLAWKFRKTLTREDLEDVVHNTFVTVQRYASSYTGLHNDASAKAWIYKIASSNAYKMIKASRRQVYLSDDLREEPGAASRLQTSETGQHSRGTTPEDRYAIENQVEKSITLKDITSTVDSLSDEEREMFNMRFEKNLTFDEIGRFISRSKPRAKQKVDDLVAKIRKSLGVDTEKK